VIDLSKPTREKEDCPLWIIPELNYQQLQQQAQPKAKHGPKKR
jgi:aspartate-semialdehyde dehydrogenase